jgi:6-pyruvoyltetrahydropterin/6-carboxytetrahydropterin synthase
MGKGMYQVGVATEVRAFHIMPGVEGPEGVLHSHDYRLEVIVERAELDERGMVCDIDLLEAALATAAAIVRDENLEIIRPDGAEAVTVEVFAKWAHGAVADAVRTGGGEMLTVKVWESPDAYGGFGGPVN